MLIFGIKVHLIDTHLLVPRSRSSAKVKVKFQGHVSQKMGVSGALVFHKHILFSVCISRSDCMHPSGSLWSTSETFPEAEGSSSGSCLFYFLFMWPTQRHSGMECFYTNCNIQSLNNCESRVHV